MKKLKISQLAPSFRYLQTLALKEKILVSGPLNNISRKHICWCPSYIGTIHHAIKMLNNNEHLQPPNLLI